MVTTVRGKTYAQRKEEAESRTKKLVSALKSEGKKVTGVTSEKIAKEEGIKYTSATGEIKEDFTPETGPVYQMTSTLYQTQYGETAPPDTSEVLTPSISPAAPTSSAVWSPTSKFFQPVYEEKKEETYFKPVKQEGRIIGYESPKFKQSVIAPAGYEFTPESLRRAELEFKKQELQTPTIIGYESPKFKQSVVAPKGAIFSPQSLAQAEEEVKFYERIYSPPKEERLTPTFFEKIKETYPVKKTIGAYKTVKTKFEDVEKKVSKVVKPYIVEPKKFMLLGSQEYLKEQKGVLKGDKGFIIGTQFFKSAPAIKREDIEKSPIAGFVSAPYTFIREKPVTAATLVAGGAAFGFGAGVVASKIAISKTALNLIGVTATAGYGIKTYSDVKKGKTPFEKGYILGEKATEFSLVSAGSILGAKTALKAGFRPKGLTKRERAFTQISKELKKISKGTTKFEASYRPLTTKATRAQYSDPLKTKTKVTLKTASDVEVGIGKSKTLIFRDVINKQKNLVQRIILSKKYPEAKFKITYDTSTDVAKITRFWKGKKISSDVFKVGATTDVPQITYGRTAEVFGKKEFIIKSPKKITAQIQTVQEKLVKEYPFTYKPTVKTKTIQVSKIKKPARVLKYETGLALKQNEIDYKNWLLQKKTVPTKLALGDPAVQEDIVSYQLYETLKGEPKIGFEGEIYRAPRTKTSIQVIEDVETIIKTMAPKKPPLFVQPIPTPFTFQVSVPKFEVIAPASKFTQLSQLSQQVIGLTKVGAPQKDASFFIPASFLISKRPQRTIRPSSRLYVRPITKRTAFQITSPEAMQINKTMFKQVTKPVTSIVSKQIISPDTLVKQIVSSDVISKSKVSTNVINQAVSKLAQPSMETRIIKPELRIFKAPLVQSFVEPIVFIPVAPKFKIPVRKKGYEVFVRREGQFKKISRSPLDKLSAMKLGAFKVGRTAAATFKIRPTLAGPALERFNKPLRTGLKDFLKKRVKGETLFIEPKEKRIKRGTKEIEQITLKGLRTIRRLKTARRGKK